MSFPFDKSLPSDTPGWIYILKEEYKVQGGKHQHTLDKLNFSEDTLSYRAKVLLECCAKSCQILRLNELNHSNMLLKRTDLLLEKNECDEKISKCEEYKLDMMLSHLREQNAAMYKVIADKEVFKNPVETLEKVAGKSKFYKEKMRNYMERISDIVEKIPACKNKLNFDDVLENNARIKRMDEEIKSLNSKLANPKNLPPNITLAREKLQQAKDELEKLNSELKSKIEKAAKLPLYDSTV